MECIKSNAMRNRFLSAYIVLVLAATLPGCGHEAAPTSPNASGVAPTKPGASLQAAPEREQARMAHINAMRDAARQAHAHTNAPQ